MIRASAFLAAVALGMSLCVHLGGLLLFDTRQQVQMQGGAPQAVTRLGNSFQDVASGVQTPIELERTETSEQPEETVDHLEPTEALEQEQPSEQAQPLEAQTAALQPEITKAQPPHAKAPATLSRPQTTTAQTQPDVLAAKQPQESAAAPVQRTERVDTTVSVQSAPVLRLESLAQATRLPTVQRSRQAALTPVTPQPQATAQPTPEPVEVSPSAPTVIEALPNQESETATRLSARPAMRPKAVEDAARARTPAPRPAQRAASQPKPRQQNKQGQNQPRQTAGQADGQRNATARQTSNSAARAQQAGNAAVSNYPGKVQRKINRTRRPTVRGKGSVTVTFRIARNGGLAALGIARSSGNARLDKAALDLVRRAAPFPAPPAGARTSYRLPFRW